MQKALPQDITTYDLLKCLAVVLMVIDHTGHHFFPDEMWFRTFGRLCVPIWFFLLGYAQTTARPLYLWSSAVLISASALIAGQFLFPLNILFTILLVRKIRDGVVFNATRSPESMRGIFFIMLCLSLPSAIFFEYGSLGVLFVIFGYIVQNKEDVLSRIDFRYVMLFLLGSYTAFFFAQSLGMPSLSAAQALTMILGFAVGAVMLWRFHGDVASAHVQKLCAPIAPLLRFGGRYTLEIYVVHVLLFRAICMYLYPDKYAFMAWQWMPAGLLNSFF